VNAFIEYNPLDYENLAKNCAEELMRRDPCSLPLQTKFTGAGVYALFYTGDFAPYAPIRSPDAGQPIYVGKAVLKGGRKGVAPTAGARVGGTGGGIYSRVAKHVRSITSVNNLRIEDFHCRFLVVTPVWITMAERLLIERYRPIWNVCLDGFGLNDPGKERSPIVSWWDAMHPDRPTARGWKARIQRTRTVGDAIAHLQHCLQAPPALNLEERDEAEADEG
jgi:hypothetical protein